MRRPVSVAALELVEDLAAAGQRQAIVHDRWAGGVAAQLLEAPSIMHHLRPVTYRDRVVPPPPGDDENDATCPKVGSAQPERTKRRRYSWAELMKRVFLVDVLICEHCGGTRKLLTFLSEPRAVRRILEHLGLPSESPPVAAARPPPDQVLPYA